MYSLISFATQWGTKYGGINSFNTDFLTSFGVAYYLGAQVFCIVASASDNEIREAHNAHVTLVPLQFPPQEKTFSQKHAIAGIDELKKRFISIDPEQTVWLGHDRITGAAAIESARIAGGRSALIHHMSYAHYESYAENAETALRKEKEQVELFHKADIALAIGPLLRNALYDRIGRSENIHMLIPGLAEIVAKPAPRTFTAFLSGRLSEDAARIKQGHLGIAGFAKAYRNALEDNMPDGLCQRPRLVLRGVDFESAHSSPLQHATNPEIVLQQFARQYARAVINLQALPYTQNRLELYGQLSAASVALMPSWHEGFGLTAWEAIAAGVPLIISKDSGVFRLLEEELYGAGTGSVYPIVVDGSHEFPFFSDDDLHQVASALKEIANKTDRARKQASNLRSLLDKYTWPACAEKTAKIFGWILQKGSIPVSMLEQEKITPVNPVEPTAQSIDKPKVIDIPKKSWKPGGVIADSQLLLAEKALVPFDSARQPDLDLLNVWLDDNTNLAAKLITGAGGLGKTRLAIELCQQRLGLNWYVGFLDKELEAKDMLSAWSMLRNLNLPLLIVIDYAETLQIPMLSLIKAMLQNQSTQPVRLLLLARDSGEWWKNLPGKNKECESFLMNEATSKPHCLPELYLGIQERQQAYKAALKAFSETLQVPAPKVIPELSGEHFSIPLYLQMAALLALHGERPTTAPGLTKALLYHERRYWRRALINSALPEPEQYAEQLLALTTLAGNFLTTREAQIYWNRASKHTINAADFNHLFHTLKPLYPGNQGLQAVRPDLLGETLVAEALRRYESTDLLGSVLSNNASKTIRHHALNVIARVSEQFSDLNESLVEALTQHYAHCCFEIFTIATGTSNNLPILAEEAFVRLPTDVKSQVSGILKSHLADESVQLDKLFSLISEVLLTKAQK
jgi:glycosyltransferase involved in cell wall biosynthesis